jgi:hypothetical protein
MSEFSHVLAWASHVRGLGRPASHSRNVAKINLRRVVSLAGFIGRVHGAMVSHPVRSLRGAAQRQIGALEKEIGFDIKVGHCPGEPLAIIRSALMSSGANHVSLLFTGSIRNALQMMLENWDQPIFGEAAQMHLPAISRADFYRLRLISADKLRQGRSGSLLQTSVELR